MPRHYDRIEKGLEFEKLNLCQFENIRKKTEMHLPQNNLQYIMITETAIGLVQLQAIIYIYFLIFLGI